VCSAASAWRSWTRIHPACLEVLFAAASIGAVTTVVNWRVIGDELVHVLDDCGARLLLIGAELQPTVESVASHFSEGFDEFIAAFDQAGISNLLKVAPHGEWIDWATD
jgi:acyl-CoA synthetase (AMP-forming)/AMP-acid ligase II